MSWVGNAEPTVQRQRGRWVVRVSGYDPATGRRRVQQLGTYSTKKAATAFLRDVQSGRAGGEDEVLQAYLREVWLPSKEARVEPSTFHQYEWAVERHIVPLIGAVRLRDLSPEAVDRWLAALVAEDADGKPRLSGTSARLVRKILSMAMEDAVRRGRVPRNPVALTQPPKRSTVRARKSWTLEECRRFLAVTSDHRLSAAFHLALVTGLRRGELLGLRWEDVDLERGTIEVVQQLTVESGRPLLKDLKAEASHRVLAIGSGTVALLEKHHDAQVEEAAFAGSAWQSTGLVFTTELGGWIDPNNFKRLMTRLATQAGVPQLTPKGLRHTAQSVGRVVVGDDKVMQERLGHSDLEITLGTYTHLVEEQHRQAGALIDAVFLGTT